MKKSHFLDTLKYSIHNETDKPCCEVCGYYLSKRNYQVKIHDTEEMQDVDLCGHCYIELLTINDKHGRRLFEVL